MVEDKPTVSVNYLMSGPAHLPYLVVSLFTLRRWWDGPIRLHAWDESIDIVDKIAEDKRLSITKVHRREPELRRKDGMGGNSQFADKIRMMQGVPDTAAIYLDADTMVTGSLSDLVIPLIEDGIEEFAGTQFNNWRTNSGVVKKRIQRLEGRQSVNQKAVELLLNNPMPSVNGGVFSCYPRTELLAKWYEWTCDCRDLFIADETVLHAVMAESFQTKFGIVAEGTHNSSPRHSQLHPNQVHVWHFHGDSNVRPNKSPRGVDLWWPVYQQCLKWNIGYINNWKDSCRNKWIPKLEEAMTNG